MGPHNVCFFAEGLSEIQGFEKKVIVKFMIFANGLSEIKGFAKIAIAK